jgi:hypothetical protein
MARSDTAPRAKRRDRRSRGRTGFGPVHVAARQGQGRGSPAHGSDSQVDGASYPARAIRKKTPAMVGVFSFVKAISAPMDGRLVFPYRSGRIGA